MEPTPADLSRSTLLHDVLAILSTGAVIAAITLFGVAFDPPALQAEPAGAAFDAHQARPGTDARH